MVHQSRKKFNNLTLTAGVLFALTLLLPQGVYSQEGTPAAEQVSEAPAAAESVPQKSEKRGFWGKRSKKNKDKAAPEVNSPAAETLAPEAVPAVQEPAAAVEVLSETPAEAEAVVEDLTAADTALTDALPAVEEAVTAAEETTAAAVEEAAPMAEIQDAFPVETLAQDVPPAVGETVNALEEAAAADIAEAVQAVEVQNEIPAAVETIAETAVEPAVETFVQELPAVEEKVAEIVPAPEVQPVVEDKNKTAQKKIEQATKANNKDMQLFVKEYRLKMNAAKTEAERLALKEEYKIEQSRKAAEHQQALDELKAALE